MTIVEKNDVDISSLFNWGRVFVLESKTGQHLADVYMRLLGDADANRARVYALRKSGELRRALHDMNSGERVAFIKPIEDLEKEDLVNYIVFFSMREINNRASREVSVPKPKPPKSNAALSKLEKFQKEVDEWPERFKEAYNKFIKKEIDTLKKEVQPLPKEELYRRYVKSLIEEFCEQEALRAYRDMEIYLGCYRDDKYKELFFDSFEQYDNMSSEMKEEFGQAYRKIEVDPQELKKLREATR